MTSSPLVRAALAAALACVAAPFASGAQGADSLPPPAPLVAPLRAAASAARDTVPARPRAVDVSSGYDRRLTIHRWGSYVMLPLFAAQYVLGDRLIGQKEDVFAGRRREPVDDGLRNAHLATAIGVGTLFTVNTVTGVWNWVESRGVTEGRTRRAAHALAMLAADAGFVATGLIGRDAVRTDVDRARTHRNVALTSMGISTVSAAAMLILNRD
jgi:hypothetical protein